MKITYLFFFCFILSHVAEAQTAQNLIYRIEELSWDETIEESCAAVLVHVAYESNGIPAINAEITLDGNNNSTYRVPKSGEVEILTDTEVFSANITPNPVKDLNPYPSARIEGIKLSPGKRIKIYIELRKQDTAPVERPPVARKPVLYFYPEREINIDITLAPKGQFTFTYPKYDKGWSAVITPDGNIQIDGKNYPYLFWEGQINNIAPTAKQSGFIVKAEETVAFLEEKLKFLGLNEREMTDFITFWAPQLEQNPYNFMHFVTGADYEEQIAQLSLSQTPDSAIRIHLWYAPLETNMQVKAQKLQPAKRSGFSVVEWGGGKMNLGL